MTFGDMDFSPLNENDIPLIKKYLALAEYEESNHNLVNLLMWQHQFPLFKYISDNWVLLLGIHQGTLFLYMPLCERKYLDDAIEQASAIFHKAGINFVMSAYTKDVKEQILMKHPQFCACSPRESYDYVYEREKLVTLSGKKLQKRRNHYNGFMKMYGDRYKFEPIESYIEQCKDLLKVWKNDDDDDFLYYERLGTEYVLDNFQILEAKGGCLLINDKVEGFIIGSYGSKRMVQINIEKANDQIRGIYQVLESEFLSRYFTECELVNREDDMGKQNLRDAKMASMPLYLIEKYRICEEVKHDCQGGCKG
jgi:hypothetical protein